MAVCRCNERGKQWMRFKWLRLEFRMKLTTEKKRVGRYLNDLNVCSVWSGAGNPKPASGQNALVFAIELVPMAVPLADLSLTICPVCERSGFQSALPGAQSHRASQLFDAAQFAQFVNHAMRRCGI